MQPSELFAAALRHHQAGRLSEAERLYREILQADATHGDALHCLGVVAHQRGRNDVAVELITRAIVHGGRVPAFHNNLGNALKARPSRDTPLCGRPFIADCQSSLWKVNSCVSGWRQVCCARSGARMESHCRAMNISRLRFPGRKSSASPSLGTRGAMRSEKRPSTRTATAPPSSRLNKP